MNRILLALSLLVACAAPTGTLALIDPDGEPGTCDAPTPRKKLALIIGQSGASGTALTTSLPVGDPMLGPYPAVRLVTSIGNDGGVVETTPIGPLEPRPYAGVLKFGHELALGRALDAADPGGWDIAKFARSSTSLGGDWNPTASYPYEVPDNLFTRMYTFVDEQLVALDDDMGAVVWDQAESDSTNVISASRYARNLRIIADLIWVRYQVPFYYGRLHIGSTYSQAPLIREQQGVAPFAPPSGRASRMVMVDKDACALGADHVHLTGPGYICGGAAYGAAIVGAQ